MRKTLIAIAPFLKGCPGVVTLGVRASIGDYSLSERKLLASAARVLFPTRRYARLFEAAGKMTFPGSLTYGIRKSRLLEETLLSYSGFPHPVTRFYFGRRKAAIPEDVRFPLLAMGPLKADPAERVESAQRLAELAEQFNPLIIQEYIPFETQVALVFVDYALVGLAGESRLGSLLSTKAPALVFSDQCLNAFVTEVGQFLRSFRLCD
ncbi:MAG: hypothetical protein AAGU11_16030, partial [Syntrophobacteraceae bacterium]